MTWLNIVAESIPFLGALAIVGIEGRVKALSENMLKLVVPDTETVRGYPREIAVKLAERVYSQLSFVCSWILSGAAGLSILLRNGAQVWSLILVVSSVIVSITLWIFRWSPLVLVNEADANIAKYWTRGLSIVTTLVIWAVTVKHALGK